MLKDTEIRVVNVDDPENPDYFGTLLQGPGLMALRNLVFRSRHYTDNRGYYGDVWAKLNAAKTAALAVGATEEQVFVAQTLAAVVRKLRRTPGIRAEDEGSQDAKSFYSSPDNWDELALDVLNSLMLPPGGSGDGAGFIVAERLVPCTGRASNDELYNSVSGWYNRIERF